VNLTPLYAIVDADVLAARGTALRPFAEALRAANVSLLQYRDKNGAPQQVLTNAAILSEVFGGTDCRLILNDRVDLALLAHFGGVHLGQDDLPPQDARTLLGPNAILGLSTHTDAQVLAASATPADYVAIGPIFATGTKLNAAPVVGLEGVRRARALTSKPLVAIGGITRANCRAVLDAGADSVAVISALFPQQGSGETVQNVARDFLDILR
jgi:thiamine-phosphate pyrophosphorylase